MPAAIINRQLPAVMAIVVGLALRISSLILLLTIAMYYLRPYLIKERDERERREMAKRLKEEEKLNNAK